MPFAIVIDINFRYAKMEIRLERFMNQNAIMILYCIFSCNDAESKNMGTRYAYPYFSLLFVQLASLDSNLA